jgi:hypothetical protein
MLTRFIEINLSPLDALEFANEYGAREILCRLVLNIGPSAYNKYIIDNVQRWNYANFLEIAMDCVYREERAIVAERKENKSQVPYNF